MAFCTNCGAQVDGQFCSRCGASAGAPVGSTSPTATGLSVNLASALCYLFGFITGIIFLLIAPYNQDARVRFHAFQSIFFNIAAVVISVCVSVLWMAFAAVHLWFLIAPVRLLVNLVLFGAWIYVMLKAYMGERVVYPIIGPIAERQANATVPPPPGGTMGRAA